MSDLQIKPAVRSGIKPLVGFYGKSGGGKTRSALLLARGIVGPKGRIALIDSESGRGSIFADKIPGGYQVIDLEPPFNPGRYVEAFKLAEANADIVVTDSLSHAWAGEGGVLEMQEAELDKMAGQDYRKRDACKMSAWIKPKSELKKLIQQTILRSKLPVICCLRGEEKTHMVKEDGKTKVVTDEWSTPIFDHRFIFEMLVCAECYSVDGKGGYLHITKITHEDLFDCLPKDGEQVSVKHGELLAKWSIGTPAAASAPAPAKPLNRSRELKASLWALTQPIHQAQVGDSKEAIRAARDRLYQWLIDEMILTDTESLDMLTEARLADVIAKVHHKLGEPIGVTP